MTVGATVYKLTPDTVSTQTTNVTSKSSTVNIEAPDVTIGGGKVTIKAPGGFAIVG
ncbi:hypothetical protein D9M72_649450 [compost metagenome]